MGITGELVKSVFSKTRSASTCETSVTRGNVADKRKWSSVRSYLCGDEFNSVLAEEDSASVKSSEATVTQPVLEDLSDKGDTQSQEHKYKEDIQKEKQNSISKLFHEEDAAITIQSAFRRFLARRQSQGIKTNDRKEQVSGTESPTRDSIGTSIEVQTGNSVELFSVQEESVVAQPRMHQKPRTQILKMKEEWDDSTVSSNISKMRIQNRLEATTRRERALAYAFSQQLRICSKKKQTKSDGTEPNMGWSWLERWMATRVPESFSVETHSTKQLEPFDNNQRLLVRNRLFDVAGEEKESCGSNEVSVQFDSLSVTAPKENDGCRTTKNRLKAPRSVSRRKTLPSYKCPKENAKVSKKENSRENGEYKKHKQTKPGSKTEIMCEVSLS